MMIFGDDHWNGDSNQFRPYYKPKSQSSLVTSLTNELLWKKHNSTNNLQAQIV